MGIFSFLFGDEAERMRSWSLQRLYDESHAVSSAIAASLTKRDWTGSEANQRAHNERYVELEKRDGLIKAEIARRGLTELGLGKKVLEQKLGRRL